MFRVALEPLSKPRPTDANGPDLRTPAQRMGDGFHELLRRFLASGGAPSHSGEKPQIVLTIDPDKLRSGTGTAELLHTGETQSLPAPRRSSPATPRSASTPQASASVTAGRACPTAYGSIPAKSGACSNSATAAAPSPAAIGHPRGARRITSSPGARAARPPSTTASCSAATTTDTSTKAPGTSEQRRTGIPSSSHPDGSTSTATPSATTASETRTGGDDHVPAPGDA